MATRSLTAIRRTDRGPEGIGFTAVLSAPDGSELHADFPADALLHYEAAQRLLLTRHGLMFIHPAAEGREPPAADEAWRNLVDFLLDRDAERPQMPAPAPPAPTPENMN